METCLATFSYVWQSFKSGAHSIKFLLGKCEILLLHENFIPNDCFAVLHTASDEFAFASAPAQNKKTSFDGRTGGGLVS